MALVRKLRADWLPSENPSAQVGDVFNFPGDVTRLVEDGKLEVVTEAPKPAAEGAPAEAPKPAEKPKAAPKNKKTKHEPKA